MYYILYMTNICIYPIFNQRIPGIWDDFVRIRGAASRALSANAWSDVYAAHFYQTLKQQKPTGFAFGAWDGDHMIGFIQGDIQRKQAVVHNLFVLPEYQSGGIGARLLAHAESAAAVHTNTVDLVSMPRAEKFYRRHGYTSLCGTNEYVKNIAGGGRCQVVPVFRCLGNVARVCAQISARYNMVFDPSVINRGHQPGVVYLDVQSKIRGYGVADTDGCRIHVDSSTSSFTAGRLEREMTRIIQFTSALERGR